MAPSGSRTCHSRPSVISNGSPPSPATTGHPVPRVQALRHQVERFRLAAIQVDG